MINAAREAFIDQTVEEEILNLVQEAQDRIKQSDEFQKRIRKELVERYSAEELAELVCALAGMPFSTSREKVRVNERNNVYREKRRFTFH